MEKISKAEDLIIHPTNNGFIVRSGGGPESMYKVENEWVFTNLNAMFGFFSTYFYKGSLSENEWQKIIGDNNPYAVDDEVYGGGS